jgi:hypothetical protein
VYISKDTEPYSREREFGEKKKELCIYALGDVENVHSTPAFSFAFSHCKRALASISRELAIQSTTTDYARIFSVLFSNSSF